MALKEMPKVGDKVRYVGGNCDFLTYGREYGITGVDGNLFEYIDDDGDIFDDTVFESWELVTEPRRVTGLMALPKVGEKLRYRGSAQSFMTCGGIYEVTDLELDTGRFRFNDDEGVSLNDDDFTRWELAEADSTTADAVNSPLHYTQGNIEVIDYIDQVADGYVGKQAVYVGNVIKYVSRAPYKNQAQDIRKAIWYAQRLAAAMEAEASE